MKIMKNILAAAGVIILYGSAVMAQQADFNAESLTGNALSALKNSAHGQEIAVVKVSAPNIENALNGFIEGDLCDFRPGEKCYRDSGILTMPWVVDYTVRETEAMLRAAGYTVIDSTAVLVFMNFNLSCEYAFWYSSPSGEDVKVERYQEIFYSEPEASAALGIARKEIEDSGHTLRYVPGCYNGKDANGRAIWITQFEYIKNIPAAGSSSPAPANL